MSSKFAIRHSNWFKYEFPGITSRWMWLYFLVMLALNIYASQSIRPFALPDESAHYFRAREVSQLHLINTHSNTGVFVPCDEYKQVGNANGPIANYINVDDIQPDPNKPCIIKTTNTAGTYSPVLYLFSAAGFALADQFNPSYQKRLYMGRLFNAIGNSIVVFLALCLINLYRPLLAAASLIPVEFWLRASVSADAVATSFGFFYICFVLRAAERNVSLQTRDILLFSIMAIAVGATKPFFSILPFAALILMKYKPGTITHSRWFIYLIIPGMLGILTNIMLTLAANPELIYVCDGCSVINQTSYILHHPIAFIIAMLHTANASTGLWFFEMTGDSITASAQGIILLLLCFTGPEKLLSGTQRFFIFLLAATICALIAAALYTTLTPVGHTEIYGLQGREFIAPLILIMIAIGFSQENWICASSHLVKIILGYLLPLLLVMYCLRYKMQYWGL